MAKNLGTLTLDLVAKTGMFERGLDQAGRKMSATEKKAVALGKTLGNSLLAGAGLAAAGIALYAKNTIEAEKVQAQLAARIKDTGGAAGRTVQQLNKMADAISGKTIFDDEAIGGAQALLLTFTQIQGINFDRATEAVADLATVMGTDLNSAAKIVGKSLADPVAGLTALKKSGVIFNDEQKKLVENLVKTGKAAEAQSVILDALQGKMGSAAEAARNTLGGALQGLENDFNNLLEGDSGGEGVKGTTQAINDLAEMMRSPQVKQGVDSLATAIVKLTALYVEGAAAAAGFMQANFAVFDGKGERALQAKKAGLTGELGRVSEGDIRSSSLLRKTDDIAELKRLIKADIAEIDAELNRTLYLTNSKDAAFGGAPRRMKFTGPPSSAPAATTGAKTRGSGSRSSAKDNSAEEALRAQEQAARDYADAIESLNGLLDQQAITIGGELTSAAMAYRDEMVKIQETSGELQRLGKLDAETQASIAQARDQATEAYRKQVEAIEATKSPMEELLEDMRFENELLKMNNAERLFAIQTRDMDAASIAKYGQELRNINIEAEATKDAIEQMDILRNSTKGLFSDLMSGAKSAKEAFTDFLDSVLAGITELVAQQLTQQLFGAMGETGGGSAGGFFATLFGSLFGSAKGNVFSGGNAVAFANGGVVGGPTFFPMNDGRTGLMGEAGPEAIMPLRRGPDGKLGVAVTGGGGGSPITIINNVAPTTERRSAMQVAQRTQEKLRTATARNV